MKALILTTALVISVAFSNAQNAAQSSDESLLQKKNTEVAILQRSNDLVNVLMEKEPRELVKIKVYDGSKLLYVSRVKKDSTANIKFDISEFPAGDYVFEVEKNRKVISSATIHKSEIILAGNN